MKPFTVVYHFKVKPGREAEFEKHWTQGTERFVSERGSLGSRLVRQAEGVYFAIAHWPARAGWEDKRPLSPEHAENLKNMAACTESISTLATGDVVSDRWV